MKQTVIVFILLMSIVCSAQPAENLISLKHQLKQTTNTVAVPNIQSNLPEKKSGFMAVVYSLLLPGMGELYAGNYSSGKYFTAAEGVLWGFYAGFNIYSDWQEDNYKAFAVSNGGVSPENKDADYYAEIGKYIDIDTYNNDKALNRELDLMYNTEQYFWKWDDQNERKEYRNMWLASERAGNNVRFVVGGLIVNRIVSAINAALAVKRYNKGLTENPLSISTELKQVQNLPPEMRINFSTSFSF